MHEVVQYAEVEAHTDLVEYRFEPGAAVAVTVAVVHVARREAGELSKASFESPFR